MLEPYILEKGGKRYMYRSTSRYSPEKRGPVAETEYMGIVIDGKLKPKRGYFYDETTGEFGPVEASDTAVSRITAKRYGDSYFLFALQKRLNILSDLEYAFGSDGGRKIMAVAMAYTLHPSALMHMESVIESGSIAELLDIPDGTDFSSPRMSELTAAIGRDRNALDTFFGKRITGSSGEYIFDLTSESTYSSKNALAEWGRNKDNANLRQVNLGLVTDRKGRPLMFYLYPGSMADVSAVKRMVDDVKRLGGKDSTLIMDRGFVSPKSLYCLLDERMDFVMPMIIGDSHVTKSMVTSILSDVDDVKRTKVYNGRSYTVAERQIGVRRNRGENRERRETVWEDPDGYDLILDADREFGSCDLILDAFVFRDTEAAGSETSAMDVALDSIIGRLEGTHPRDPEKHLRAVAGRLANMLDWSIDGNGMHLEVKQNAHTFAKNRKGVFIMVTPASAGRSFRDVLQCYDCRDRVEDAFLEDKSEGDGRTPRTGSRDAMVGRTFVRMVSMIMVMEMVNRISEVADDRKLKQDLKPRDISKRTPGSLLASLSNIEMISGPGWKQMTEATKDNRLIYRMFDIGPPSGVKR